MQSFMSIKDFNDFEIRCITYDFSHYQIGDQQSWELPDKTLSQAINHIVACIVKGDYESVLQTNLEDYGLSSFKIDPNNPDSFICNIIERSDDFHHHVKEFILIFMGISALQEFIRWNFCGPRDSDVSYKVISNHLQDISDSEVSNLLSVNGQSLYPNIAHLKLLFLSHILFSNVKCSVSLTQKWWLLRCTFLYQSVLLERSETLHSMCVSLINDIQIEWLSKCENISQNHKLKFIFDIECCHIYLYYGDIVNAQKLLEVVQNSIGFEVKLDGALGKRRKDQQVLFPQLFVKCTRKGKRFDFSSLVQNEHDFFPCDLHLQDVNLLNKIEFVDNNVETLDSLCIEEQIVLLAYCLLVKKNGCFDELSKEEAMSYVTCLLSQPQVWSVYVKALIMRCKMEKDRARCVERAVFQMETIVESIKNPNPPLREREKFFFCTSFPPYWKIEKDLADLLLSIGCVKTALEVYERLQLWEEMVKCYTCLGLTSRAEKIIRDLLAKEETPLLWCLLGDVTENIDYYLKAWDLSKQRNARAQCSLGYHYFKRKEYKKSIPHFLSSLDINHLQPSVWYVIGQAAVQTEDFKLAIRAYKKVVMFDNDNFKAWTNLANSYAKTNQKIQALHSLREALKCNFHEPKVWENLLLISTDIRSFEDSLLAWRHLLDLKNKYCDTLLLEILINAIVTDIEDIHGKPSSRLKKRALEILKSITERTTDEPRVWELYSLLIYSNPEENTLKHTFKISVDYQRKAVNCYNKKLSWERHFNLSKKVLTASLKLAELYLSFIQLLDEEEKVEQRTSARLNLQSILTRSRRSIYIFPDEEQQELSMMLDSLHESLNKILNE